MSKMKIVGILLIVVVFGYLVGSRFQPNSPSVLTKMRQHAPADTLVYFESQSDEALFKFTDQYVEVLSQLTPEMSEQIDQTFMPETLNSVYKQYLEFFSTLSQGGLVGLYEQFSVPLDGYSVFYLDGLMPVLHVEITDKAQFELAMQDITSSMDSMTILNKSLFSWSIPDTQFQLVMNIADEFVTFALLEINIDQNRKAKILAITAEVESIIDTNELTRINEQYQFNTIQGFFNIEQLVGVLLGESQEVDQDLNSFGFDAVNDIRNSVDEQCKNEYLQVIKKTPKYVFGAKNIVITDDAMTMDFNSTLEINYPELTQSLMTLNGHIPEYVNSVEAMVSFYYGAEVSNVVPFMSTWVTAINAQTYDCDHLKTLQEQVSPSLLSKAALGMQMFKSIKSAGGTLFNLDLGEMNDFEGVDAFVSIVSSDPKTLAVLASNIPQLGGVKINETPTQIPLVEMMYPGVKPKVQIAGNSIVAYSGQSSEALVETVSNEPLNQNGLLMLRFNYAQYMDLIMGSMFGGNIGGVLSEDQCINSYKSMSVMKDFIDSMAMKIAFSENGLDLNYTMQYNKVELKDTIEPGQYELRILDECDWLGPDLESINADGSGSYTIVEHDEMTEQSCETYHVTYDWKQELNTLNYKEASSKYRDACDEAFIAGDESDLETYDCEIFKITDKGFECVYYDEEYDSRSIYSYRLKRSMD